MRNIFFMYKYFIGISSFLLFTLIVTNVSANNLMVYPAQGQNQEKQSKDDQECRAWATNQTGVNPATLSPPQQQQTTQDRKVLRGAAAGAAVGGLGGSMGGEFGKGAAVGAAVGALGGGIKRQQSNQQTASVNQQSQQIYQDQVNRFNRAYSACMEGRGYNVK